MCFDTPEFREMMTFWKEMHDEDLIYFSEDAYNDETPVLLTVNTWGERFGKSWPLHYVLDNDFLYPPTPDGIPAWNVEVYEALYMNRYGAQKELAAEFVALFMSPEVYGSYMRDWETGKSHLLREIPLYAEAEQTEIQEKYGVRWSHNGRDWEYYTKFTNYDLWVSLNENAVYMYHLPELSAPFDELFNQYLKGEVDLETFIAEMEKHADLWMNE